MHEDKRDDHGVFKHHDKGSEHPKTASRDVVSVGSEHPTSGCFIAFPEILRNCS